MTNKEIEEKIASMEKELAVLKNELTQQDKIWQPKENEEFWLITGYGSVVKTTNCLTLDDKRYIEIGNYFKTEEEAEKQVEYNKVMNRFRKYAEAYSEPLDWEEMGQKKYFVYYDNEDKEIVSCRETYKDAFKIYASSEQILKDAIIYSAGSEEEFIRIVFGENDE